jgi:hypothetical protein
MKTSIPQKIGLESNLISMDEDQYCGSHRDIKSILHVTNYAVRKNKCTAAILLIKSCPRDKAGSYQS